MRPTRTDSFDSIKIKFTRSNAEYQNVVRLKPTLKPRAGRCGSNKISRFELARLTESSTFTKERVDIGAGPQGSSTTLWLTALQKRLESAFSALPTLDVTATCRPHPRTQEAALVSDLCVPFDMGQDC
jgi:hypothetical protein